MSNSGNHLPPDYEDMHPRDYDPTFTANISSKMRVPDRLGFTGTTDDGEYDSTRRLQKIEDNWREEMERTAHMNVPDKLIVAGQDKSMGLKSDPNLHLDFMAHPDMSSQPFFGLKTPPRVIKLDEQPFMMAYEDNGSDMQGQRSRTESGSDVKSQPPPLPNGYMTSTPPRQSHTLEDQAFFRTPGDTLLIPDDEADQVALMQRQIAKLSRHVLRLEDDNSRRSTRELFLYPTVLGYILFQVAKWFLSNK